MKRSRNLKLVLLAAAVPVAVSGCDTEPTGNIVRSVADCQQLPGMTQAQCESAYQTALLTHQSTAPQYTTYSECAADFDGCTAVNHNGLSGWVPPMAGFLIGYALGSRERDSAMHGGGYYIGRVSPLYRNYRSGEYYNANADYIGNRTGTVTGKYGRYATPTRAITVSRSGFGSSSAARSSFSSGGGRGWGG